MNIVVVPPVCPQSGHEQSPVADLDRFHDRNNEACWVTIITFANCFAFAEH